MDKRDEKINPYALWLHQIRGLGDKQKIKLSAALGGSENIYFADKNLLMECNVLKNDEIEILINSKKGEAPETLVEECLNKDISFVSLEDEGYPENLKFISDMPYGIYYRGFLPQNEKTVGMVGARACSQYGKISAIQIAETLAKAGYTVVSGMAKGVDGYSHRGALNVDGKTLAVLGCGIDICYPTSNHLIYEEIPLRGCIISEFPPGTEPLKEFFPKRNRIISALSDFIIVVEARLKSGSLITANLALEQGKDVYAIPGRINDPMSAGCNHLISEGAGIITSFENLFCDIRDLRGDSEMKSQKIESRNLFLENDERLVYSCLDFYARNIDEILSASDLPLANVLQAIVGLSEKGLVKECFKNEYIKLQ